MGLVDLEVTLTDEQKAMRDLVKKFGAEVMRPAAIKLDKLADPEAVIAKDSVLWDVTRAYRKLGLHRRGLPEAMGGLPPDALAGWLIGQELGYAASDLAISWGASGMPFTFSLLSPDPEIRDFARQYAEDTEAKMVGCWAITEPDHGSDWLLYDGDNATNPKCGGSLRAVKEGSYYVLNGQKAAWVSNGTIATHALLFMSLDSSTGQCGGGVAVIPLDLPGVSRGKPLNKMGQRALNQGEIFFDGVKIPERWMMVSGAEAYAQTIDRVLGGANAGMSVTFSGLGRAALDEALAYARERIQGGVPIIQHQAVQFRLFKMFKEVEAANALSRRVSMFNRDHGGAVLQYSIAAKVLATDTAFNVASEAIQIFGGVGLTKEYHIEKIFRDARASMIEDGVNETLAIAAGARLA